MEKNHPAKAISLMTRSATSIVFGLLMLIDIGGCDQSGAPVTSTATAIPDNPVMPAPSIKEVEPEPSISFDIGEENPRYLFIVNDHTENELMALLDRANQTLDEQPDTYEGLDIVIMLHGPDIDMFRKQNYAEHRSLIDLAAKLDAFHIIDMQVCDTSLELFNIGREEVPPFIESVPYAPDEIEQLQQQGYINL